MSEDEDSALWLSISDIAREKNVDKSLISRQVAELEKAGAIEARPGPNKTKLINLAEFDAAIGQRTDLVKGQAAETTQLGREATWGDNRFRDEQTKKIKYEAALKSIELRKAIGSLVEITQVEQVIADVGEEIRKPLDQIPLRAEEIHAVSTSGGVAAVRAKLKETALALRMQISDALSKLDIRTRSGTGDAS